MINGYMGSIIRVDLGKSKTSEEKLSEETLRTWIGGSGLGGKYLFEEVSPKVAWNDPENRVMLMSGPLAGTRVSGSGTFCACTKGALTGGATSSQANGYMGAYLKFCGYDGMVIQGKSADWAYLYVDEQGARLRDARHLTGLDTWELQTTLRRELGTSRNSIFGIGPAGENQVRFAALVGDEGHVVAHNGVGAVLGSKKLKAIVVAKGRLKVPVHDGSRLDELSKTMVNGAKKAGFGPLVAEWGTCEVTPVIYRLGALPVKNLTTNMFPEYEKFTGRHLRQTFEVKTRTCWRCSIAHCRWIKINKGKYAGFEGEEPEYEGMSLMGPQIGQKDPAAAVVLANMVDRLGMDVNESGWVVGWVMECYEKGLLGGRQLDGLEMKWGDVEATRSLLEKIAYRQGIGDMLAEGVKRAAERVGGEAKSCAVYTLKGNTPRGHDHRAIWTELFDTCLSNTGTIESTGGSLRSQQHDLDPISNPFDWEQVVKQNALTNGRRMFEDCLGICRFNAEDIHLLVGCVQAATGWDLTLDEAMTVGRRAVNLMRIYNLRSGITAELDEPSKRYGSVPVDGPVKGISSSDIWGRMKRRYYELMGWDLTTGYPLDITLKELGLDHLIPPEEASVSPLEEALSKGGEG